MRVSPVRNPAPLSLLLLTLGLEACAPAQPEVRPTRSNPAVDAARARAEEAEARAEEARARAEEAQALRDAAKAQAEAEAARRRRAEELGREWNDRFATRSAAAQQAFKTKRFVPGMSRDEVKLLVEYRRANGELLELKRTGEREELGGKKRETWIHCQPDCGGGDEAVKGMITFDNDVLTSVQTGWVAP